MAETWTFEKVWANVDKKLVEWKEFINKSTDSLAKEASDTADQVWKSFLDKALAFSKTLTKSWNWWKEKAQWVVDGVVDGWKQVVDGAIDSWKQVVEAWKNAIGSVSDRVNSFQDALSSWLAIIKKEWGQYIVEVKNDAWDSVKMAMERTTTTWKEVLTYGAWKWQYVTDGASDYTDKAKAIASVAYDNTVKPIVKTWKAVVASAQSQYEVKLAWIKWETSMAAKWEKPPETTWEKPKEHQVKVWDTLSKIALNEVGWDKTKAWEYLKKILEANKWIDPNKISVWQKISLPKA